MFIRNHDTDRGLHHTRPSHTEPLDPEFKIGAEDTQCSACFLFLKTRRDPLGGREDESRSGADDPMCTFLSSSPKTWTCAAHHLPDTDAPPCGPDLWGALFSFRHIPSCVAITQKHISLCHSSRAEQKKPTSDIYSPPLTSFMLL